MKDYKFGNVTNQVEAVVQPFKFVGQFGSLLILLMKAKFEKTAKR